jgi:hypothetical protein
MYASPTAYTAGGWPPGFVATINGNGDLAIQGLGGTQTSPPPGFISGDFTIEVTSMRVFGVA